MSYPKWLYHPTLQALIVPDEAAHKALGSEWVEAPVEAAPPPVVDDRETKPTHKPKKGK